MSLIDEMIENPENIKQIGYLKGCDDHPSRLDIEFKNGVQYEIHDFPEDLWERFQSSPSWSTFFALEIYYQYKDRIKVVKK